MEKLNFTQGQITQILSEFAKEDNGINQVMQISLEALMKSERELYNETNKDVSNGYRRVNALGHNKELKLQVPRSRKGNFYPVLLGVLRNQEEEYRKVAFSLYGAGLTTAQVGDIFEDIYGKSYSTSHVSRLFNYAREEVKEWLDRALLPYYPIVYIDATFIYTRRGESVSKEAYYTILGVRPDRTREVLAIVNFPTESSMGWKSIFEQIKSRGVERIDLFVSDGLNGVESAIAEYFSDAQVQLCSVHLQRNVLKHIKPKDKTEVIEDLKEVFQTGIKEDSISKGWERWLKFLDKHQKKYTALKHMREERYRQYFTFLQYDYRARSMLYTTNWVERLNRDYKRTTRMRGALPNSEATILLMGYVAMTRKAYNRKIPKINYEKSFEWDD